MCERENKKIYFKKNSDVSGTIGILYNQNIIQKTNKWLFGIGI